MRNRTVIPAVPYLFLQDAGGGQCFDAVGSFHTWDTIGFQTSDFKHIVDNDKVNIIIQGYYEVTFEVSFYTEQILREVKSELYKNGVLVANSHVHTYVTGAGGAPTYRDEQVIHFVLYLSHGDYIQIKTTGSAAGVCTDPASSRLLVKFVEMKGWNNKRAGSTKYPFRQEK